jgi:3-hydroxyisobutyrate dehydrogenase-like beta-hydroxyacid dehydrogenase
MRVAFVGLGAMGSGIVRRLLAAEREVTGWNRTRAKAEPLLAQGMGWADTPREAAAGADVVFSMLTDAKAVQAAALGDDGILAGLRPGTVYADMSTVLPEESRALAERVAATGAQMLDAPVSGSMKTLEEGQLSVMVGGDRAAFDRVEPLFRDMGPKVTHVGGNGAALVLKLAINLSLVVQVMSFCESVAVAEAYGIERQAAVEGILKSVIASPVLGYRGPFVIPENQPEVAWSDVKLQQKDQQLGLGLARSLGAAVPFATLGDQFLTATRAAGHGDKDFAAAYEVFRSLAGLTE